MSHQRTPDGLSRERIPYANALVTARGDPDKTILVRPARQGADRGILRLEWVPYTVSRCWVPHRDQAVEAASRDPGALFVIDPTTQRPDPLGTGFDGGGHWFPGFAIPYPNGVISACRGDASLSLGIDPVRDGEKATVVGDLPDVHSASRRAQESERRVVAYGGHAQAAVCIGPAGHGGHGGCVRQQFLGDRGTVSRVPHLDRPVKAAGEQSVSVRSPTCSQRPDSRTMPGLRCGDESPCVRIPHADDAIKTR